MRPFLLVGCGGSGGVTLQFLLDQLAADLSLRGVTRSRTPGSSCTSTCPSPRTASGRGCRRSSTAHPNGTYAGLAPAAGSYAGVANALVQQLLAADSYAQLATWFSNPAKVPRAHRRGRRSASRGRPRGHARPPRRCATGSHRRHQHERRRGAGGATDARPARSRPGSEAWSTARPWSIVVSSMAGGAGASMVLDVCRVLSQQPSVDPASTALFLYTPEIFEHCPTAASAASPATPWR